MIFVHYSFGGALHWYMYRDERIALAIRQSGKIERMEDVIERIKKRIGENIYVSINLVTTEKGKQVTIETDLMGWKEILIKLEKYTAEHEAEKWVGGCYIVGSRESIVLWTTIGILPEKYSEAIKITEQYEKPYSKLLRVNSSNSPD